MCFSKCFAKYKGKFFVAIHAKQHNLELKGQAYEPVSLVLGSSGFKINCSYSIAVMQEG